MEATQQERDHAAKIVSATAAHHISKVLIEGETLEGEIITYPLELSHQAGIQNFQLYGQALSMLRQMGGILQDRDNQELDFYPLLNFKKIHFSVNKILLAK